MYAGTGMYSSPTGISPVILGPLSEINVSEICKKLEDEQSPFLKELVNAPGFVHFLYSWTGGVPRFVDFVCAAAFARQSGQVESV